MAELYLGDYDCPTCGSGSSHLRAEWLALVLGRFGENVKLKCQVCYREFLVKTLEVAGG